MICYKVLVCFGPSQLVLECMLSQIRELKHSAGLQGLGRNGYQHYKGPYLDQLGKEDLQHPPVPWLLSICGGDLRTWAQAYNLPEHTAQLQERLEENLVRYRVRCQCQAFLIGLHVIAARCHRVCAGQWVQVRFFSIEAGLPKCAACLPFLRLL